LIEDPKSCRQPNSPATTFFKIAVYYRCQIQAAREVEWKKDKDKYKYKDWRY